MIRLACTTGAHSKFWAAEVKGTTLVVYFGRIGTDGQVKTTQLATAAAARATLAKLIGEKVRKGYALQGAPAAPAQAAKPPKPPKPVTVARPRAKQAGAGGRRGALLALAELLAPGHVGTRRAVTLAVDKPAAYQQKYADDLEDRNADDDPVDPWLTLDAALTDEAVELARPIDWKESADEIEASLRGVVGRQRKLRKDPRFDPAKVFGFYDPDAHLRTKTIDFIAQCGRALSAHGLAVVSLDIGSDSYELTVIPWADVARAQVLARQAGGGIVLHGPKTPLRAPLPGPAPRPRGPLKIDTHRLRWQVMADSFRQLPGGVVRWVGDAPGETTARGKTVARDTQETLIVDCRAWPPRQVTAGRGRNAVVMTDDGSRIIHRVHYTLTDGAWSTRPSGVLRIERRGQAPVDLLDHLPDNFTLFMAAFVGDLVVLIPTHEAIRGKIARRPLVWNGTRLAPAKGLADATPTKGTKRNPWPWFLRAGVARTGDGRDVLIWEGKGYTATGDRFVQTWQLAPDLPVGEPIFGRAAPGDGFFYVHARRGKPGAVIRHATGGASTVRARIHQRVHLPPCRAPDGRLVMGLNRYGKPKSAALAIFHPDTEEVTMVPAHVLGFTRDDQPDAYGVSAPARGEPFLWVLDDEQLRRVAWAGLLALPRVPGR